MIKVNLCPVDELENQYWYVPDLLILVTIAITAFLAVDTYHDSIRERIDSLTAEQQSKVESTNKLLPDLERFKTLDADIEKLRSKLQALQGITVARTAKYRLMIALEHLHNLKPDGLWIERLKLGVIAREADRSLGSDQNQQAMLPQQFEMVGQAFDNILTAEYMTGIRATESHEVDGGDPRTSIGFSNLDLKQVSKKSTNEFEELAEYPAFELSGTIVERVNEPTKSPASRLESRLDDPPEFDESMILSAPKTARPHRNKF